MASKKKDVASKDKEPPRARGRPGPASATRNELAQGRKGKRTRAVPKIGKHDSGEGRSHGEGLH